MILRHLHLPGPVSYTHAACLQSRLVTALLAYKSSSAPQAPPSPVPDPTLLTTHFHPVYTCGRREIGTISPMQIEHLTQRTAWGAADFQEAQRGGQTTFHGPGQLIAYPIIDLRRHGLRAKCYVRMLEEAVRDVCGAYGVATRTTEHSGVWDVEGEEKLCAVGVHLRRNVTSHGIGLNVYTELGWFERIVGCGLKGKGTTSLRKMGVGVEVGLEEVAEAFVKVFARRLEGVEGVRKMDEEEIPD